MKLLAYALGRPPKYPGTPTVRAIVWDPAPTNYKPSALITAIVKSLPFQTKPVES